MTPWTPDMDDKALRLQGDGHSAAEIGRRMGITRSAVIGRLYRLRDKGQGLPKRVFVKAEPKPKPTLRYVKPKVTLDVRKAEQAVAIRENSGRGRHLANPKSREPWRPVKDEAFAPLPGSEPVPLLDRAPFTCAWVVGGEGADSLCCGQPATDGAYCPTHRKMAFLPTAPLRPRDFRRWAA